MHWPTGLRFPPVHSHKCDNVGWKARARCGVTPLPCPPPLPPHWSPTPHLVQEKARLLPLDHIHRETGAVLHKHNAVTIP